jgi:hypothetical protein
MIRMGTGSDEVMTKIDREKIVRAVVGSARLEGYKGSLKVPEAKKAEAPETKPKATAKR